VQPGTYGGKLHTSAGRTREQQLADKKIFLFIAAKRHTGRDALRRCDDSRALSERLRRAPLLERVCPQITGASRRKLGARGNRIRFPHQIKQKKEKE
jgi:hypothetical protein